MAWTQADIDAIKAAIARGEKSVTYSDRTVVYRDIGDLLKALEAMQAEVQSSRPRRTLATFSRGT